MAMLCQTIAHCSYFMGLSFQVTIRNILYAPFYKHDSMPVVEYRLELEVGQWEEV